MTNQTEPPCLTAEGERLRDQTIEAEVARLIETPDGLHELLVDHDLAGDDNILFALVMAFAGVLASGELRAVFIEKARAIAEKTHDQGPEYWNDLAKHPMEIDDD